MAYEPKTQIVIEPIGPPAKPPTYLYKAAKDWTPRFFESGLEYINRKRPVYDRLKSMFVNQMPLSFWYKSKSEINEYLRQQYVTDIDKPSRKRTDETVSISQYVLHAAEGFSNAVFEADPWFSVTAEATLEEPSVEDPDFSTAQKMENLLNRYLRKAFFKQCSYKSFQWLALLGSVGGMVRWYEKKVPQHYMVSEVRLDGSVVDEPKIVRQEKIVCAEPHFDVLPPDQVIVDPSATTSDVQKWYGVGHITEVTRAEVIGMYENGILTLNEAEFKKRWGEPGSAGDSSGLDETVSMDPERSELNEAIDNLQMWGYHGLLPTSKGDIESVVVFLTEKGALNCSSGVLAKCHEGTALHCGLRPFVWAEYTPFDGPYALGAVEPYFSNIWMLSHLKNLLTDNLELAVNAQWQVVAGSEAENSLSRKDGDLFFPGNIILVDQIDKDIAPFRRPDINFNALDGHIQYLDGQLQMLTTVSDSTRGVSTREKTASEVNYMMQQATAPMAVRLKMLAETFLDPTLSLFLNTIQQYELSDQVISVTDSKNVPINVMITADELRSGKYSVQSIITQEDTQRIAITQTLERILQTIMNLKQVANAEGWDLRVVPILREMFKRLRIPRMDQIFQLLPEQTPGPEGMPMGGPLPGQGEEAPPAPMPQQMGPQMPAQATAPTGSMNDMRGPLGNGTDNDMLLKQLQEAAQMAEGMSMQQ